MSTIRLQGKDIDKVVALADHILSEWRKYTDRKAYIIAESGGEPHNTITPIARMRKAGNPNNKLDPEADVYELDLVLRNNITTDEHPLGLYHPHAQYHHIKKENIGLIEVMGLAVLPARLKKEMASLEESILNGTNLYEDEDLHSHIDWAVGFLKKNGYSVDIYSKKNAVVTAFPNGADKADTQPKLHKIIQDEIGYVFSGVLEDAGVYKRNAEGREAFMKFIKSL